MIASTVVPWTDKWQAVGTVVGALVTSAAVIVALLANRQSRKIADKAHESAQAALLAQQKLLRDQVRRDFLLTVLLQMQEAVADAIGWASNPQGAPARSKVQGLLAAIPGRELPVTRFVYGTGRPDQRNQWAQDAHLAGSIDPLDPEAAVAEIGGLIARIAESDSLRQWPA